VDGALDFDLDDVAMDADDFFLEGSEDGAVDGIDEVDIVKEGGTKFPDVKETVSSSSEVNVVSFRLVEETDTRVEPSASLSTSIESSCMPST
jgi:hypothetical protein